MVGVDPEIGTSALRLWLAAGSAALLIAAGVLAFARPPTRVLNFMTRTGVLVLGAIIATSMAWAILDRTAGRDHDADRRVLEMRAAELTTGALAPGSSLACLDALAGESVEAACEKALFATPASVAAAISYVAARFALLSDMVAYTRRGGTGIDGALLPLRRSLESDRFGFVAHALAVRDDCTSQDCKPLALLQDPKRIRANLSGATLDRYLDHYQTVWALAPDGPVAEAAHADPAATAQLVPLSQRKVLVNIDFPTAASIPPVSIMNPEPTRAPPAVAGAGAGAANPSPAAASTLSSRRSRKPAAIPPPQTGAQDPVYLPATAPAPSAPAAPETTTTAAAPSAAPTANLAPGGGAPVQLNPFASSQ
jgi:hypothetical protein